MKIATAQPVFVLCALLLTAASPAAGTDTTHGSCPHHSNVEGQSRSHSAEHAGRHCGRWHHGRHGGDPGSALQEELRSRLASLGLSETQKQELGSLFRIYEPRFRELVSRGRADREALLQVAPDSDAYDTLVGQVSQEAAAATGEMVVLLAELQANAYALLTPEQQARYRELRTEAIAKAREHAQQKEQGKPAAD